MPRWLRLVLDRIRTRSCEVCRRFSAPSGLCVACRAAMPPLPPPLCVCCGAPVPGSPTGLACRGCAARQPAFATARAAALYLPAAAGLNPFAVAIHELKYHHRRPVADALGDLLAERYPFPDDALLVPVPLHVGRLRQRGFNQALLLARALARRRHLTVAPRALRRLRDTRAQPGLTAQERRSNLCRAFALAPRTDLFGTHVVLVDDVLTTGATADACARVLTAAGAARVDVYTAGRVP